MLQIFVKANYDFVGKRKWFYVASAGFMLLSLATILYHGGLNYGIDFTGGALVQVRYDKPASVDLVRKGLVPIFTTGIRDCRRKATAIWSTITGAGSRGK